MLQRLVSTLALIPLIAACGPADLKGASTILAPSGGDDTEAVQTALIEASDGDIIGFKEGTWNFSGELSLGVANVTLKGSGETVWDFKDQTSGANGLRITSDGVTIENLTVKDTQGDGIRADDVKDITFRRVRATWTAKQSEASGAYGLYPVLSERVLIEDCVAENARDAGIYVGQSHSIIVKNSEAFGNVAGIEIENSYDAEVFENHAHDNTGGFLVFGLPGLEQERSDHTRAYDNLIEDNNIPNFAAPGNIVGLVPPGTGVLVFASDQNEFFGNTIQNNVSFGFGIVNYDISGNSYDDPNYDPYPEMNWIHDNTFTNNGQTPSALAVTMVGAEPIGDIAWDGAVDPSKDNTNGELTNCFMDNLGDPSFLNFAVGKPQADRTTDLSTVTCERTDLPEVTF